jgi:hypothetical protein
LHSALDNWIERIEFENWLLFYLWENQEKWKF